MKKILNAISKILSTIYRSFVTITFGLVAMISLVFISIMLNDNKFMKYAEKIHKRIWKVNPKSKK